MSDLHEQESEFSQLMRGVPCDDAVRAEHRDALRARALALYEQAQLDSVEASDTRAWWKRTWNQGKEIMKRPMPRLIVVTSACLFVAGVWLFAPGRQTAAQAFNKLAETLVAAKSARFQMEVATEGQPKQTVRAYYLAPGRFRQELPFAGVVNISDLPAGKMVTLMPAAKRVMVMNIKGAPKNEKFQSQFDRLRELLSKSRDVKDAQYQRLGEKDVDGRHVVGFRYDSPSAEVTLWGDPATGYPVRIETVWSGLPRTEVTMNNFEINLDLTASLFDVTPPAGYKVQSLDVDVAKPSEQGLIKAFRTASEVGGGEFLESLDTMGMMTLIIKAGVKGGTKPSDEDVQRLMKISVTMGIGFQFALDLPESADAHYAGKGVKRDTPERPIFWYKPEGTSKYRVIFADLTVNDEADAPQVPGAKRIAKASKTAKPPAK
jgi:outer membrane lipoprotein-sorting protein